MALNYKPLWIQLAKKGLKKTDVIAMAGLTTNVMAQMGKDKPITFPNFKLKLATQKKFTWRLVVQAFFRVVVNPIFDKSYFFRSRFLGSFR